MQIHAKSHRDTLPFEFRIGIIHMFTCDDAQNIIKNVFSHQDTLAFEFREGFIDNFEVSDAQTIIIPG